MHSGRDDDDDVEDDIDAGQDSEGPGQAEVLVPANRIWISSTRMTRTETSLRLALHLLTRQLVASDLTVALTGNEMKRKVKRPPFQVEVFLNKHGCQKVGEPGGDWQDIYTVEGATHALVLREKADEAPMVAVLPSGARLLIDVLGGPLESSRSNTEHVQLRTAIGRAITLDDVGKKDVLAVAMPRSSRFRDLARRWRQAPRLIEARIRLILVDRVGQVDGLQGLRRGKT